MKRKRKNARKIKRSGGVFSSLRELFSRYAVAGVAGLTVVLALGAITLWAGGYVGLVGEQAGRMAQRAAISSGFGVRRVTAIGLEETAREDVLNALGPIVGASIAHVDVHAARARIEDLGWVRSAAVARLWPGTIHVSVREREPAAVWQMSGALHLIDPYGAVIREINAYEFSNLPLIVGAGAPDSASLVLQALRAEPALWGGTSALVRVGDRRWNLRLKSGADVKLPENESEAAVATLAKLQAAYGLLDRPLEYIDLRNPDRFVYRERGADGEATFNAPKSGD
ncbi:MAG: cell division protein FtsQ/DivIB [Pseudomonadota bacterium]